MTMKKILGISLVLVMLVGSVPLGFSESLRVQLEQELDIDQIQCDNPNHVLVQRTNGNVACVTEKGAERTGWQIIENVYAKNTFIMKDSNPIETQKENIMAPQNESKLIPNPTGYWVPIPDKDREDFAKLFVNAAGDSLTGELGRTGYLTEYGHISDTATVLYLHDLNIEPRDREKFTEDFMDFMGFEYYAENVNIRDNRSNIWYNYSNEYSGVEFRFTTYMDEIKISFYGWTNNPELVTFPLSEKIAIQKAFDFIKTAKQYYISESDGGKCDVHIRESAYVMKYVESGMPYYKIKVGNCTHSITYIITADIGVYVIMDGITGEDIYTNGGFY